MASLSLKHIYKVYEGTTKAVNDFNMEIRDKEFIVFVGPSGCGKSTTLRMIAGLEDISAGELRIDDVVVNDMEPKDRNIAMVFQNYALYPHMTVYENMAFSLRTARMPKDQIHEKVMEAARILGITEYLERKPRALSGGQRQRVALGRAIVRSPKVFLLDEPLSNLDAKLRTEMRTELKRLHVDTDSTFVYVTHDQLEAMTLSTKVCLMEKGLLQQYAAPLEMYLRPANLFVADFMGSPTMNFLKGTARKTGENTCEVQFCGLTRTFTSDKPLGDIPAEVTLGVRPEFISIAPGSDVKASVYSTLPSGMETTVKLRLGGEIVTSVIFGSVDFPIDTEVSLAFHGTDMLLYSTASGDLLSVGSL